jgi:hypothetical protein
LASGLWMGVFPDERRQAETARESVIDKLNGVAQSVLEAMKGSPLVLAVIMLNILFIAAGLLYLRAEQAQMDRVLTACLDRTK